MQTHTHTCTVQAHMKKKKEKKLGGSSLQIRTLFPPTVEGSTAFKGILKSSTPDNLLEAQSGLAHLERDPLHGSSPLLAASAPTLLVLGC